MFKEPALPGIAGYIALAVALLVFWGAGQDLDELRALLGRIDTGDYVTGTVAAGPDTLESPFFSTPCVMYRALEEKGERDDDGTRWHTVSDEVKVVPFDLDTDEGRLRIDGQAATLAYPDWLPPRQQAARYHRTTEWSVPPNVTLTILGRPKGAWVEGTLHAFRGNAEQWRAEVRGSATGSVVLMVLMWLLLVGAGGYVTWRLCGYVLGAPLPNVTGRRRVEDFAGDLARTLMHVDLDWLQRPPPTESAAWQLVRLACAGAIAALFVVALGAGAAVLAPIFWGGFVPSDADGAVQFGFANHVAAVALMCAMAWVVREAVSMYFQQRSSETMGRLSDSALQILARLMAVGVEDKVELVWNDTGLTVVARIGLEELRVELVQTPTELRMTAAGEGRPLPPDAPSWPVVWTRKGEWTSAGGDPVADVPCAVADVLGVWLLRHGVGRTRAGGGDAVELRVAEVVHVELPVARFRLDPVGGDALPRLTARAGAWRSRHVDGLVFLGGSFLLLALPTAFALALTQGWLAVPSPWAVFAPLAFIPGVVVCFRPPVLGPARRRQVRSGTVAMELRDARLTLGGATVDLQRPFRVHLTSSAGLLGVEIQTVGGPRESAVRFNVPLAGGEGLPTLEISAPVLPAADFLSVWPAIRLLAQAHGEDIRWEAVPHATTSG